MTMTEQQLETYWLDGHVTVPDVFTAAEMDALVADMIDWGNEFLSGLGEQEKRWYLEDSPAGQAVLRKLDNPVFFRPSFRAIAGDPRLTSLVRQIIGDGLSVRFSQIFCKPPSIGGPKPMHQDNYYFGCDDRDGMVTAWLALDDATIENGCLHFADGSNKGPIYPHVAPEGRAFDLQLTPEDIAKQTMTPAPVPKGGISFHHGNTLHQSADNRSNRWRRAVAMHFVNDSTVFATPALPYDDSLIVAIA
ncbi:phytanoyl-CoA dioxygenase family protein [Oceanibacterium hippocampi]|uniref:Phytanoyl-CoA dioxygenase (PhyH) n=1 Tax=Oceanibacterium hippocampi TaxID=745714 RepID=A0A1Y5RY57_9PROT|nr:phytanoyl-CoA dioxygenase family protein [Oceanibacterium hippocampi]SLN27940.1 Phytanoyl-CoA dioxygenase (PhyH) [Oceanibacterium hippocampi]